VVLGVAFLAIVFACAAVAANGLATEFTRAVGLMQVDEPFTPESAYRDAVMADSPRAYWRLGEASGTTAADETANNPGLYKNGVTLGRPGAVRNSVDTASSFDGVDDSVSMPDSNTLDATGTVTIEVWVKRIGSSFAPIAGKPANGQSKFENYSIWLNNSNRPIAYFGNGQNYVSVTGPAGLDTNWHQVVATYNNATARLYVDGVQVATASSSIQLTPNVNAFNIGR
jgi:hypothetical protein